jgi:hypothetical protein
MHDRPNELRLLRAYATAATLLLIVFTVTAFRQATQRTRFTEIDVERINLLEPDGTLRLAISDKARFPDPVIGGKAYHLRSGAARAGFIFFNDKGDEDGGMTWSGRDSAGTYRANAGLSFDQFNQDETITLDYDDNNGRRMAGLTFADRPDKPLGPCVERLARAQAAPEGQERTRQMGAARDECVSRGELQSFSRAFIGKTTAKAATVVLSDRAGKPRLRLVVDSLGAPSVELLDEAGRVTSRIPEARR